MLQQHPASLECFRTLWTLAQNLGLVTSCVIVESTCLVKSLTTIFADIWLVIGMCSLMTVQVADVGKSLIATFTTVVLGSSMDSKMCLHV